MITIDKAILHILDFNSGITVFSDNELPIEGSNTDFLLKHVEKSYNSQDAKPGDFYPDSEFEKKLDSYLTGGTDFVTFSKEVGQIFADAFGHTEYHGDRRQGYFRIYRLSQRLRVRVPVRGNKFRRAPARTGFRISFRAGEGPSGHGRAHPAADFGRIGVFLPSE